MSAQQIANTRDTALFYVPAAAAAAALLLVTGVAGGVGLATLGPLLVLLGLLESVLLPAYLHAYRASLAHTKPSPRQ